MRWGLGVFGTGRGAGPFRSIQNSIRICRKNTGLKSTFQTDCRPPLKLTQTDKNLFHAQRKYNGTTDQRHVVIKISAFIFPQLFWSSGFGKGFWSKRSPLKTTLISQALNNKVNYCHLNIIARVFKVPQFRTKVVRSQQPVIIRFMPYPMSTLFATCWNSLPTWIRADYPVVDLREGMSLTKDADPPQRDRWKLIVGWEHFTKLWDRKRLVAKTRRLSITGPCLNWSWVTLILMLPVKYPTGGLGL